MRPRNRGLGILAWALFALFAVLALPGAGSAAWLGYRNDTKSPVIVQAASIVNNTVRLGRPHLLYSGEIAWDAVIQAGAKVITVYDAKTKRVLYKDTLTVTSDQFFSVQTEGPKANLVPAKMPRNKPSR
jgi:hypothetical protein